MIERAGAAITVFLTDNSTQGELKRVELLSSWSKFVIRTSDVLSIATAYMAIAKDISPLLPIGFFLGSHLLDGIINPRDKSKILELRHKLNKDNNGGQY